MNGRYVKLNQPPLVDFTTLDPKDDVLITIINTKHKFATDAEYSGCSPSSQPIFGCQVHINNKKYSEQSFGLPFIRFAKGSVPKITYQNRTLYTFNLHYHGLNTVGDI